MPRTSPSWACSTWCCTRSCRPSRRPRLNRFTMGGRLYQRRGFRGVTRLARVAWSARRDSNSQSSAYRAAALPLCYGRKCGPRLGRAARSAWQESNLLLPRSKRGCLPMTYRQMKRVLRRVRPELHRGDRGLQPRASLSRPRTHGCAGTAGRIRTLAVSVRSAASHPWNGGMQGRVAPGAHGWNRTISSSLSRKCSATELRARKQSAGRTSERRRKTSCAGIEPATGLAPGPPGHEFAWGNPATTARTDESWSSGTGRDYRSRCKVLALVALAGR